MASSRAEQRAAIRRELASLRRLLNEVQPLGMLAILQDVGEIEGAALVASAYEMPGVREKHHRLMERLKGTGIITAERFQKFFVEADS